MIDYKTNDPIGWCGNRSRGAALGRPTITDAAADAPIRLSVSHVRLNDGGYDCNGTYFGEGRPLYWVHDQDGLVDFVLRAWNRDEAVMQAREDYPNAVIRKSCR